MPIERTQAQRTTQKNKRNGSLPNRTITTIYNIPTTGQIAISSNATNSVRPQWLHPDVKVSTISSIVVQLKSILSPQTIQLKGGTADEVAD